MHTETMGDPGDGLTAEARAATTEEFNAAIEAMVRVGAGGAAYDLVTLKYQSRSGSSVDTETVDATAEEGTAAVAAQRREEVLAWLARGGSYDTAAVAARRREEVLAWVARGVSGAVPGAHA